MQALKISGFFLLCASMVLTGCVGEQQYNDLKFQNAAQAEHITKLTSDLAVATQQLKTLQRQLDDARKLGGIDKQKLQKEVALLEQALREKNALVARMQEQLLGGSQLPVELSTMLEDFARQHDMVTYDSASGIVKFKSDLLFEKGSDEVKPGAVEAVEVLCGILNSKEGGDFDVIIAGHTDDIPISRAATRAKHPTNWHLSAHRAISVLKVMANNKVAPTRLSARGFGEYRPVAPNKANKGGNPQNRRVEIYIVPRGM